MTALVESVFTCYQLTGLGAFYTYFLAFVWTFQLSLNLYIYIAFLGALIVFFSSENRFRNLRIEPKTLLVSGLFGMSVCSAALAAVMFAEKQESKESKNWILKTLPKVSILLFFISFCITRTASIVYVTALNRYYTPNGTASCISWIASLTLFGLKIAGFFDFLKNLASCIAAFGFLFLSIALFLYDRLPVSRGFLDSEIAEKMGFLKRKNTIKHEEHRKFTDSEGTVTHFFRNLTTEKLVFVVILSNENDTLENHSDHKISYIRSRGHARISIKLSQNRMENNRFLVLYSTLSATNKSSYLTSDSFVPTGCLTIPL